MPEGSQNRLGLLVVSGRARRARRRPESDLAPIRHCVIGVLVMLFAGVAITQNGCGGDDLVVGGMVPLPPTVAQPTATPECAKGNEPCERSSDCCSGVCRPDTLTCRP